MLTVKRLAWYLRYARGWIRARNRWGWWIDRRELPRLRAELEDLRAAVASEVVRLRSGHMDAPVQRERDFTADGLEAILQGEAHHPTCLARRGHECSCFRSAARTKRFES